MSASWRIYSMRAIGRPGVQLTVHNKDTDELRTVDLSAAEIASMARPSVPPASLDIAASKAAASAEAQEVVMRYWPI